MQLVLKIFSAATIILTNEILISENRRIRPKKTLVFDRVNKAYSVQHIYTLQGPNISSEVGAPDVRVK